MTTVLGGLTSAGSGAPPPSCNVGDLQLRASTVNQGLPYDRLVRGKETLVRLYLSLPSCAGSTASIQITGGTLRISGAGTTLATGITGTPSPVNVYPSVATYSTAALNDAPADVKFVVPGSALAPTGTTASYTAAFRADLTYQYKTSSNATAVAATKTFDNFANKTVEKKTNALRILVVPMGNTANSYSTEFPQPAVAAVENGMQTLSRVFPVPSGVGTLGSSTGGIRYAITPTLLNVGSTPWCGDGGNFDAIKAQLAQFLVSWNTANPGAQADRVVGAISSDKSLGGNTGSPCAEGMASVVSPEAWVRAFPDSATTPSTTGALFAMEIAHTFGVVPSTRSLTFHSGYTAADGTDPNRGYNVALRSFLADDHSVMKLSGAWNNNTTILEKADYAYLLCVLGGATNSECTTPTVAGSSTGVAALATAYALTGHTNGTAAGTVAQESYVAAALEGRGTDSSSDYKLVQLAANGSTLQTTGVRVAFADTIHDDPNDPLDTSQVGTFAVVAGLNVSAKTFELRKGADVLWSARKTNPPVITPGSFTVTPAGARNFTNTPNQSENEPALTTDGKWVAYTDGTGITVAPTGRVESAVSVPFTSTNGSPGWPAWGGDAGGGAHLTFTSGGNLYVVDVNLSGAAPVFGDLRRLYNGGDARQSTISEDDSTAVFVVASGGGDVTYSDLYLTDLQTVDNPSVSYLTDGGGPYGDPSLSRGTDGDVLAVTIFNTDGQAIFTSPITLTDPTVNFTRLISDGYQPSWGTDGRLAFTRSGDVWVWTPPFLAEGPGTEEVVFANGRAPSLAGDTYAFERQRPLSVGEEFAPDDIFIGSPGRGITVNVKVTDDNLEDNRLDLLVDCPGLTYVGAVALLPTVLPNVSASWAANFDPSLTCANPEMRVAISDGYNRVLSGAVGTGQTVENVPKDPTAAIYTPVEGSTLREYDVVPARGSGWDAEDGTLPELQWVLTKDGGGYTASGTGPVSDFSPPATGFPLGGATSANYTLTLTVTDSSGHTHSVPRAFTIVEDADNDGLTFDEEGSSCVTRDPFYASNDLDPMNAFRDDDGDGIPNVDDTAICTAAVVTIAETIVDIDADMIKSQPKGVVTAFVTLRYQPIALVQGDTVEITSINGREFHLMTLRWSIEKGVGVAKFDKSSLIGFIQREFGTDYYGYVLITVTGKSSASWTFEGSDLSFVH